MKEEAKYYNFKDLTEWLNFAYFLRKEFPFNRGDLENIKCNWGMLIIPREGIEKTIQNKISDVEGCPLKELKMLYQLPFEYKGSVGVINKDITLTFRYDKTFKYGEINKSIYECCYFIKEYARRSNNFYILDNEFIFEFMSYFVINNQWGLGAEFVSTQPSETLEHLKKEVEKVI